MVGEWTTTSLGDATIWTSGGTPSKKEPSFWGGSTPWISASSMKDTRLRDSDLRITQEGLENGSRLAERDSVLLLVRGSELHKRIPIGRADRPVAFNQDVKALKAREGLLPLYLLYWLLGNEKLLLSKVEHTGIGAGKLDTQLIQKLPLHLPPISEQRAIARILGALDDKIELNRRMNETLEEMAQAIFKSWFVDFDPVRAKAEGRRPEGMDASVAELFPEEFSEGGGEETPEGWEVRSLSGAAHFLNGVASQKYPPESLEQSLPVIKISELRKGFTESSGKASSSIDPKYIVDYGDIVFSWSGSLELVMWGHGRGVLNQHLFKVTSQEFPKWFYYFWTKQHLLNFRRIAADKATTMGHIQRHHLTEAQVVIPPPGLLDRAHEIIAPMLDKIINNQLEIRALTILRDTLLPRLLSGEIRVPEAEREVEEAL